MTLEQYYKDCGKIFEKHHIRNSDRGFYASVAMYAVLDALVLSGVKPIESIVPALPEEVHDFHKVSSLKSKHALFADLLPFFSQLNMTMGDYTGKWHEMTNDHKDGAFYSTPPDIVNLIQALVLRKKDDKDPSQMTVYDPTCGTGDMLIQARKKGYKVFGQEMDLERFFGAKANLMWLEMHEMAVRLERMERMKEENPGMFKAMGKMRDILGMPNEFDVLMDKVFRPEEDANN